MKEKLTSRKFWICVAAFLGSIAASISGIVTENQTVIIIGTVCGILSAAIYAFCEAWVDANAVDVKRDEELMYPDIKKTLIGQESVQVE